MGSIALGTDPPVWPQAPSRPGRRPSGHVFCVERRHGRAWYAKYRLPDGRQVQRRIGLAWEERGRPPAGYFTKRLAEDWLEDTLAEARRGTLAGMVRTGAKFVDAAAEFLRYAEHDRELKPSTLRGYRSIVDAYLLPAFGERPIESIGTDEIEAWRAGLSSITPLRGKDDPGLSRALANSSKNRIVVLLHGIFSRAVKVYRLPGNPVAGVERHPVRSTGDIEVFSPEEAWALVRGRRRAGRRDLPDGLRSPACGVASCWRCAGATSTSSVSRSGCARATPAEL
jgi:integrase